MGYEMGKVRVTLHKFVPTMSLAILLEFEKVKLASTPAIEVAEVLL